ncbi:hypothetical protein FRC98_16775 [Lujinxingia vulgaris]|uniref:ABM domain-containing protein n=1 Tax=Lujinxingia vulgaris TaxID=2600176 RepID=A0A5C6X4B8_9DELT|nr:hypothetical protein [Lujinxingia vulgaris]TXD35124.1 hypothetical protein FRC98_16775 [Lujinxingia vulgaris]
MSTIRVLYKLRCRPGDLPELQKAWRAVVQAHARAGHQTLESVLLVNAPDPDDAASVKAPEWIVATAISRWQSRQAWESQRTDEVDENAYARFRELCTVDEKIVFEELDLLVGGLPVAPGEP